MEALPVLPEAVGGDAGELAPVAGEGQLEVDDPHVLLQALLQGAPVAAQVALDVLLRPGSGLRCRARRRRRPNRQDLNVVFIAVAPTHGWRLGGNSNGFKIHISQNKLPKVSN